MKTGSGPSEPSWPRLEGPSRALLRKEWHSSWWLLWGIAVPPVAWGVRVALGARPGGHAAVALWLASAVCALLAAAQAFASETSAGTASFLLGLPVRATTVWRCKVLLPLMAIGAVPLLCLAAHLPAWALGRGVSPETLLFLAWGTSGILLTHGAGLLAGVLLQRTATAVAAGAALATSVAYVGFAAAMAGVSRFAQTDPATSPARADPILFLAVVAGLPGTILACSGICLWLSLHWFRRRH
ncbi:MAG: hypothetical protein JXR77_12090 [Lentisphaeria bacterium]|nr:hypothetical protein [Lentisphaeria bacterium]